MRKAKIFIILCLSAVLFGCREYGEKQIVNLVTIDSENITMYCYDYSEEKPTYIAKNMENTDIENAVTELLSRQEYNLKLCRYAVCDDEIIKSEMENVFSALTKAKFSPDIAVVKGDTKDAEKYIAYTENLYPVYGFRLCDKGIDAVVRDVDTDENIFIVNSSVYRTFDKEQSFVFDMLTGNIKSGVYCFKNIDKVYTAKLEKISVFHTVTNGVLNVNITVSLKTYKGMSANEENKEKFEKYLKNSIKENATQIYNDKIIADKFNLHWYRNIKEYSGEKINVYII